MALWPLASLLRRPVSLPRLLVEAFAVTLAVISLVWLGWVTLWLIEQQWYRQAIDRSWPRMTLRVPPAPSLRLDRLELIPCS